jgi:hypothetical protein
MITLYLALLTGLCVLLTVSLLGSLRTLAGIQLRIQGVGDDPTAVMRLEYGRLLPDRLIEVLPERDGYGAVAFLAPDCEKCWHLAGELAGFRDCPLVACVIGGGEADAQQLTVRLGSDVTLAPADAAGDIAAEMRIVATPVVIFHRDGYIVASATGSGADSLESIRELWKEVAPNGNRRETQTDGA